MISTTSKVLRKVSHLSQPAIRNFASGTKLEKFDWVDPLHLHGKLTEEEKMIEEVAKNFAKEKLMP